MSLKNHIKAVGRSIWHLIPEPTGRGYVFFTVVMSILTSGVLTFIVNRHESKIDEDKSRIENFIDVSENLDEFVSVYLRAIENNKVVAPDVTTQIASNVIKQFHAVDGIKQFLSTEDRHLVDTYKIQLIDFRNVLPDSDAILNMQNFVNDYRKLLLTRETMKKDLKR